MFSDYTLAHRLFLTNGDKIKFLEKHYSEKLGKK